MVNNVEDYVVETTFSNVSEAKNAQVTFQSKKNDNLKQLKFVSSPFKMEENNKTEKRVRVKNLQI